MLRLRSPSEAGCTEALANATKHEKAQPPGAVRWAVVGCRAGLSADGVCHHLMKVDNHAIMEMAMTMPRPMIMLPCLPA